MRKCAGFPDAGIDKTGHAPVRPASEKRQGSHQRAHEGGPQVTIRDLVLGAELAAATKDRADYVELRANAQFTVPEDELVDSVHEVLWRHGATAET